MVTKQKHKNPGVAWSLGSNLIAAGVLLKSEIAKDFSAKLYVSETATPGKLGAGFMLYQGNYYHDKAVFIGTCALTKASKISFFGRDGLNQLTSFLSAYNSIEDKKLQDDFSVSSSEFAYFCPPFSNFTQLRDLITGLEATVTLQTSNRPAVTCTKGELTIGSRASSNCRSVIVSGDSPNSVTLNGNLTRVKVSGTGAIALWATLTTNVSTGIENSLASFMMDLLGKVTLSPILNDIRNDISKNYTVGKVLKPAPVSKSGVKCSTPGGVYVLRSLSGIKNKLNDAAASKEAQSLLEQWLSSLVKDTTLLNHSAVVKGIKESVDSTKLPAPDKPASAEVKPGWKGAF